MVLLNKTRVNAKSIMICKMKSSNFCVIPNIHRTSEISNAYRKVVSSRLSWLVAHPRIFRRLMKGKFDPYVL